MPGNALVIQLSFSVIEMLDRADRAARSQALRAVMGRGLRNVIRERFLKLDAERHRNETGRRFWAGAARSVQQPQVSGDDITVAVNQEGVAQRIFGGKITAGSNGSGAQWLTIPAIAAALGRRASTFTNLRFVLFRGHNRVGFAGDGDLAALVSRDPKKARFKASPGAKKERGAKLEPPKKGKLAVVYWLKRSVTQKADPTVLPPEDQLNAAANQAAVEYLDAAVGIEGGNAS